jgi:hypothetical protein
MRRPTRLGLAILAALLVTAGAYTIYWFVVAGEIKDGVIAWAQSARADKIDVSWQKINVTGFPIIFQVELQTAVLRDNAVSPSPEIRVPSLSGAARPWDFDNWRIAARSGFSADLAGARERAAIELTAQNADGVVAIEPKGGWKLWLTLQDASVAAADRVRISSADVWIFVPPKAPREHTDPSVALALNLRQVQLPVAIGPLGDNLDDLSFGVTVKGAIPNGKLAQAAAAWRDAGGTIELDNLRLHWGGLGATATGTVALDQELQPIGGFSGAIQGYDQILTALVQSGQMRATDAGLARIALTMLAKPGRDGKPEIKTAFTIQSGQMFLGPAKLGKAPRLTWE